MMLYESPLRKRHEQWVAAQTDALRRRQAGIDRPGAARAERIDPLEVEFLTYAAPEAATDDAAARDDTPAYKLVGTYGEIEAEYAAIRRGAALIDAAHHSTIRVTGSERLDFLNRMVTQELKGMTAGDVRSAFWLNRKGRVDADMDVIELGDDMLLSLDVTRVEHTIRTLEDFIFAEDVDLADQRDEHHHLLLVGKRAGEALRQAVDGDPPAAPDAGKTMTAEVAGVPVVVARDDAYGETGFALIVPNQHVEQVWDALLAAGADKDETDGDEGGESKRFVRPAGWYAANIARIEHGTPMFNVDFGNNNLPHESGLLRQRVSFTKGCYLGQEVVARMEHLGRPARMLVGFRVDDDRQPVAGAQVFALPDDDALGPQIGVVTSSTLSPMLGAASIGFAIVKSKYADAGTRIVVNAEGAQVSATVTPLQFWPAPLAATAPPAPGDAAKTADSGADHASS